jgi:hypothetical protein
MGLVLNIRRRFLTLLRSEQGMALPTALFAMIACMALGGAAVMASIDVQQGSTRDAGSKKAIAAADAGASVALLRLNRFKSSLATAECVGPAGEKQVPTGGWCPATTPERVGPATYSYMISAYKPGVPELNVVSVGSQDGVTRRVKVGLTTTEGENVFATEKVVAQGDIEMGGAFFVESSVGTNGNVHGKGGGDVCGNIRHGPGKSDDITPSCKGKVEEGEKEVPEVTPPANIGTVNSNCRLSWTCAISTEKDTSCEEKGKKAECGKPIWKASTRTLESGGNKTTLTLGGGDYFICRFLIGNGQVYIAAGATVRIFFDTPENCGLSAGAIRFEIGSQGQLTDSGYEPKAGKYEVPGLYFLGSKTIPTRINIQAQGGADEMILYAPNVDIEMNGGPEWIGMMAGKTISIQGNPRIISDPHIKEPEIKRSTLFSRNRYVECTGATGTPPDANC